MNYNSGLASLFNKDYSTDVKSGLSTLSTTTSTPSLNLNTGMGSVLSDAKNFSSVSLPEKESGFFDNLLDDSTKVGNIAGLASTFASLASLPAMYKNARLQNDALAFNLNTAKEEQGRRNKMISSFNNFKSNYGNKSPIA